MTRGEFDYWFDSLRFLLSSIEIKTGEPALHFYDRCVKILRDESNLD